VNSTKAKEFHTTACARNSPNGLPTDLVSHPPALIYPHPGPHGSGSHHPSIFLHTFYMTVSPSSPTLLACAVWETAGTCGGSNRKGENFIAPRSRSRTFRTANTGSVKGNTEFTPGRTPQRPRFVGVHRSWPLLCRGLAPDWPFFSDRFRSRP
jgi:hypothetical protein